jgi:hypothetical protein
LAGGIAQYKAQLFGRRIEPVLEVDERFCRREGALPLIARNHVTVAKT